MSPREPPTGAATFATTAVAAAALCFFILTGPARAWADEATPPVTPTPTATPTSTSTQTEPAPSAEPGAPAAAAMLPAAKAHYDRGLQLYGARDFAAAIQELELGFKLDPRREFLFAEAQAHRLAGDCARAESLYRRFLESDPSPLQVEAAQLGLDRCGRNRTPPAANPKPATPPPPIARTPAAPVPEPRPIWWRDSWAALSIGAGVAALGVGLAFEIASARARDDADAARLRTYPEYAPLWESAEQRRAIAVTAAVAGVALLAAGGARLIVLHRRERASSPPWRGDLSLAPVPVPGGGAALLWRGAF